MKSKADGVTEIEKWQAEKINSYLQYESYVIAYCDCCEGDLVQVIQIENINIEPAQDNLFQVRIRGKVISTFSADNLGRFADPKSSSKFYNELVSINYTFVPKNNKAMSIAVALGINSVGGFDIINCQKFISIPNCNLSVFDGNSKYKEWYTKHIEALDYSALLLGSWKIFSVQNNYGMEISETLPSWRINFKNNSTYFSNIGEGQSGTWAVTENELIMINEETGGANNTPFFLENDILYIKHYDATLGLMVMLFRKQ